MDLTGSGPGRYLHHEEYLILGGISLLAVCSAVAYEGSYSGPSRFVAARPKGYEMMGRIAEASPRFRARMAGGLYVFSVLTAVFFELFLRGRMGYAANLIQISGMIAVTLLSYYIFKAVNRSLSLLATFFNLGGLTFEALQLNPQGVNIAVVFHGIFCMLIGYLIYRSTFLPRILGALIAFSGLSWLTYLSPPLSNYLSPYNLACGLLWEALVFLWLLVMGVNVQRWQEQVGEARA